MSMSELSVCVQARECVFGMKRSATTGYAHPMLNMSVALCVCLASFVCNLSIDFAIGASWFALCYVFFLQTPVSLVLIG